jgi:hypothetical protein
MPLRRRRRAEQDNNQTPTGTAGIDVDDHGYLVARQDRPTPMATTMIGPGGIRQTYFRQEALESALWTFGEDELANAVKSGLPKEQVERIGSRHAQLVATRDPARASGEGYAADQAFAMAAVEVLEGSERPLARKRRRSRK